MSKDVGQECRICRGKGFFGGESPLSIPVRCEHCNGTGIGIESNPQTEIDKALELYKTARNSYEEGRVHLDFGYWRTDLQMHWFVFYDRRQHKALWGNHEGGE